LNIPSDEFEKAKKALEGGGEWITATELHKHIQASIFGPPHGDSKRFNDLQWKLHEIVDWWEDTRKTEVLKAWHEHKEKTPDD